MATSTLPQLLREFHQQAEQLAARFGVTNVTTYTDTASDCAPCFYCYYYVHGEPIECLAGSTPQVALKHLHETLQDHIGSQVV